MFKERIKLTGYGFRAGKITDTKLNTLVVVGKSYTMDVLDIIKKIKSIRIQF